VNLSKFSIVLLFLFPVTLFGQVGVLKYSTNPQYPPYDWAEGNSFAGASIELLALVLPPQVVSEPVVVPWKRALELAKTGQIDLLLSLRITPERETYLVFTTHRAFPNPIVVFARSGSFAKLDSWDVLKGHVGGISSGDTFGGGFDEYWRENLKVETADTMIENFRKLDAGRIDWFVTSLYLGKAYLATHRLTNEIVVLDPPISTTDIHFGFSKASSWASLVPEVSRRLAVLDKAGTLDQILQKHLKLATSAVPKGSFPGE